MKEAPLPDSGASVDTRSFLACVATILELPVDEVPAPAAAEDAATGTAVPRWLGGLGLGLVRIADPATFSWPGPWLARVRPPGAGRRAVVMYGVPSGVVCDPAGDGAIENAWIEDGYLVAAADIALARPLRPAAPVGAGRLEGIHLAASAGQPTASPRSVRALAGRGLEGDRQTSGRGTFTSSSLTLIEAEVCESFEPALAPDEHRRNLVTRGIDLNALVGREFTIGAVRCLGQRLCEPCTVVDGYATRPVLRALVHRGGLRAEILQDGEIRVGDDVRVST